MPRRPHISDLTCAIGLVLALVLVLFGPPGTDLYAHRWYLSMLLGHHGIWNPWWYSGQVAFVGYSIVPYLLASITSIKLVLVVSLWVSVLVARSLRSLTSSRPLRVGLGVAMMTWPMVALSGDLAYIVGVAFAVLAGRALLGGHRSRFVLGAVLALGSSALAVFFLGMVIGVLAISRVLALEWRTLGTRRALGRALRLVVTVDLLVPVGLVLFDVLVARGMDLGGRYPFFGSDLALMAVVALSLVGVLTLLGGRRGDAERYLVIGALVYIAIGLVTFPIPDTLGSNVARVSELGLAIAAVGAAMAWESRHQVVGVSRRLGLGVLVAVLLGSATYWNLASVDGPLVDRGPAALSTAAGWEPLETYLVHHLRPGQRVEAVDTTSHAAAYFLPSAGIPLMRGWYRQLDFPLNAALYGVTLTPARYVALLRRSAVAYVAVPPAPYDFSAAEEPALVAHSSAFRFVGRFGEIGLYALRAPEPLMPGAHILSYGYSGVRAEVTRPGRYAVSLRYSPYLVPSMGCIRQRSDGRISWQIPHSGPVSLRFRFSWSVFLSQEFAGNTSRCA
ncbi:MAG: hypothetical protein ACP5PJ_04550 [Acidimicrobiales bacterium]